jgi:hypothetical protein
LPWRHIRSALASRKRPSLRAVRYEKGDWHTPPPFAMESGKLISYTLRASSLPPLVGGGEAFNSIVALRGFAFNSIICGNSWLIFLFRRGALFPCIIANRCITVAPPCLQPAYGCLPPPPPFAMESVQPVSYSLRARQRVYIRSAPAYRKQHLPRAVRYEKDYWHTRPPFAMESGKLISYTLRASSFPPQLVGAVGGGEAHYMTRHITVSSLLISHC